MRVRALPLCPSLLAGALILPALGHPAGAQELRYSGSLGYSRGLYIFQERTESLVLLNGFSFSQGRFFLSAALPVIAQSGEGVAFLGGGMMPTGAPGAAHRHSGTGMGMAQGSPDASHPSFGMTVGDPLLRVFLRLPGSGGGLRSLNAGGVVKAPLAPLSSGVGTGAWDLGLGASAAMVRGRGVLLGEVTLWSPGDLPEARLREYATVSFGAGLMLGRRWSVLTSLNAATPVIQDLDPPASVGLSLGLRTTPGWSLSTGLSAGLTEASPDLTLFLGWSLGLVGVRPVEGRHPDIDYRS